MREANKEVNKLLRELSKSGAHVERATNGHWKITNPINGRAVQITSSPSDRRTLQNAITRIRRIGLMERPSQRKHGEVTA